jgi:hypothetical protein
MATEEGVKVPVVEMETIMVVVPVIRMASRTVTEMVPV